MLAPVCWPRREPAGWARRERAVAVAIAGGATNTQIARQLYVSVATVKATVSRILTRLELTNRVQIAVAVRNAGQHHGAPGD
ncbi:MAG TPA: LuxR C-terminal-related transcriptional regulator [Streptosporangiaceae bacterium]